MIDDFWGEVKNSRKRTFRGISCIYRRREMKGKQRITTYEIKLPDLKKLLEGSTISEKQKYNNAINAIKILCEGFLKDADK